MFNPLRRCRLAGAAGVDGMAGGEGCLLYIVRMVAMKCEAAFLVGWLGVMSCVGCCPTQYVKGVGNAVVRLRRCGLPLVGPQRLPSRR